MSHTFTIFGASGDLTQRKLIPALYQLHRKGRLPDNTQVVGFSRTPFSHQEWRGQLAESTAKFVGKEFDPHAWGRFAQHIYYCPGDIGKQEDFAGLSNFLDDLEKGAQSRRVYYLSTAPKFYGPAVQMLGAAGMADESRGPRRIVIEKPFGTDGRSARELNDIVHGVFAEKQVYRIDHY